MPVGGAATFSRDARTRWRANRRTKHLVLSTLHAPSALGAFGRLSELGVEPFLASEAISLAVSQRLVRRVHDCRVLDAPNAGEVAFLRRHGLDPPDRVARPAPNGCAGCAGTGYRGRFAVVEALESTPAIRALVSGRAGADQLREAADAGGYRPILLDAHGSSPTSRPRWPRCSAAST